MDDELGICKDLEREMDELVGTYFDEWKVVVDNPEQQKRFRQFANTVRMPHVLLISSCRSEYASCFLSQNERVTTMEKIVERGQTRPADWGKTAPPLILRQSDIRSPKNQWKWRTVAKAQDLIPNEGGTTYVKMRIGSVEVYSVSILRQICSR